jgi:hypothetical protein
VEPTPNHWPHFNTKKKKALGVTSTSLICLLIGYDGVRLCLRTAATIGPIVHTPGDMWAWRAMVMIMPPGDTSWLVRQSSLVVLPAETSGASRRNGRRSENFAYQYLTYLKGSLTCRKILRRGTSGFTSHPKEDVRRIFIAVKNPSPRSGLPATLGFSGKNTNHYTTEAILICLFYLVLRQRGKFTLNVLIIGVHC